MHAAKYDWNICGVGAKSAFVTLEQLGPFKTILEIEIRTSVYSKKGKQ